MFVVRDADTTIYIFGTFHALDGKSQWFGDKVRDAFEQSNELVLETLIPERPPTSPRCRQMFGPIGDAIGFVPRDDADGDRCRTAQGMQVDNGADMVLRRTAEAEGKPVEGLETLQLQLNMFNHMPPAPVATALRPRAPTASCRPIGSACQRRWSRCRRPGSAATRAYS